MAINYARSFNRQITPQSASIPGSTQMANSARGYSWPVDDWTRFDRFLILGAEGGTYYVSERTLVKENHDTIVRCIQADGIRAVKRIVEISHSGRAPKNDPAIFALALAAAHGNPQAKALAFQSLGKVCRTGTHLFHFAEYVNSLRGWGRGLRNAVGSWYVNRNADELAYQAVKYQQRDGWSHRDLLRLAHPKAPTPEHESTFRWMLSGVEALGERRVTRRVGGENHAAIYPPAGNLPGLIEAFETAKRASTKAEIVRLIAEHGLPREAVPTQWLNETEVWQALLERMPITATIRNLGKMTALGLVNPFSDATKLLLSRLRDQALLKRARIHPLAILLAQKVYARGRGDKGSLTWKPIPQVIDALDAAFYATFQNVEPCGKPVLLALDVSASMHGSRIAGSCLTAREASAAMALVTAATEPEYHIMGFSDRLMPLNISPRMRLDSVVKAISGLPFMGTDCALPMVWARENKLEVSGFVTYTDSETWAGNIHPAQALRQYREQFIGNAKAVVVGMTSNGFTLADPNDRGMLDVVGFDTTVPSVIADFIRN
ncbi:MAG: RNA-binding protein [Verrucomicrobiales bacterium]|nr:RNA-binding protein [Verrucomicrobiales bacterium]